MGCNWAVIIGINQYQHHPERGLHYAVQDAQLIRGFLCDYAQFNPNNIILCLGDGNNRDNQYYPTYSNLLRLLTRELHPDRIGQVDYFWFFFAGHGISLNGRDYLMTSDSLFEDIDHKIKLPTDEVIACLRKHTNAEIVLILDSCRQLIGSRNLSQGIGEETTRSAKTQKVTTIFSCGYGQVSYELDFLEHGSFTYALVEGLKQHTLPSQLEQYLQDRVPKLNIQANKSKEQLPEISPGSISNIYRPLLPDITQADVSVLVESAKETERKAEQGEEFQKAIAIWRQVAVAHRTSREQREEAIQSIQRISKSLSRLPDILSNPSVSPFSKSNPKVETQLDYSLLESLLASEQWREANQETYRLMLKADGRQEGDTCYGVNFSKVPCSDLRIIDDFWMKYSKGKFGFSIQKKIYLECGGRLDGKYYLRAWKAFCERVGWKAEDGMYCEPFFTLQAPPGNLPTVLLTEEKWEFEGMKAWLHWAIAWLAWGGYFNDYHGESDWSTFFRRMDTCKLYVPPENG